MNYFYNFFITPVKDLITDQRDRDLLKDSLRKLFKNKKFTHCESWFSIPTSYLSKTEALQLGIYIFHHKDLSSQKNLNRSLECFEYALSKRGENIDAIVDHYVALSIAIFYFHQATKCIGKKKKKTLKIGQSYLRDCKESLNQLLSIWKNKLGRLLGEIPETIKFLVRASRKSDTPSLYFRQIEELYKELSSYRLAEFYKYKSFKSDLSNNLSLNTPSAA